MKEVTFFDGINSRPYPATLEFLENGFRINYSKDDAKFLNESVLWIENQIERDVFPTTNHRRFFARINDTKQIIEFKATDEEYQEILQKYSKYAFGNTKIDEKINKNWLTIFFVVVATLGFMVFIYAKMIPIFAQTAVRFVPKSVEKKIGEGVSQTFFLQKKPDSLATEALQKFFEELNFDPSRTTKLFVVRDSVINAFALPGGIIVVYDKIIQKCDTPEMLAGLLGHEFGHIYYRHSMVSMTSALSSAVLFSMIFGDISGLLALGTEQVRLIQQFKFSRDFETQSDDFAIEIVEKNKISAQGIASLFKMLEKEAKKQERLKKEEGLDWIEKASQFYTTHPLTSDRIMNVEKKATKKFPTPKRLEILFKDLKKTVEK